jgi:hypothetical protein
VDQKWCDLAPSFIKNLHILYDEAYNVAYWNLEHRRITHDAETWLVNGRKLVFFHFSGFSPDNPQVVSRHQNRFTMDEIGDGKTLFALYRTELLQNQWQNAHLLQYFYGRIPDGGTIPDIAKMFYHHKISVQIDFENWNEAVKYLIKICNKPAQSLICKRSIPDLLLFLYDHRPDIKAAFDINKSCGISGYQNWLALYGIKQYCLQNIILSKAYTALNITNNKYKRFIINVVCSTMNILEPLLRRMFVGLPKEIKQPMLTLWNSVKVLISRIQ